MISKIFSAFTETAFFGIMLTLAAFRAGMWITKKTKIKAINPLFTAIIICIAFLLFTHIDESAYAVGGNYIKLLLGPATVAMAVPLYRQFTYVKNYWPVLLVSVGAGALSALAGVWGLSKLFRLSPDIYHSICTKSITAAIALGVTEQFGGYPQITLFAITVTGMTGASLGILLCKIFKIRSRIAVGLAMGTCSHAIGTSTALAEGELEGAMASIALVFAGILTSIIVPYIPY